MNNKPVAWAVWEGKPHDVFLYKEEADELCRFKGGDAKSVPLYTHPAKELGYNDIMETWWKTMPNAKTCEGIFEFAKAILRKAQKK
jgi:hypothetical protein